MFDNFLVGKIGLCNNYDKNNKQTVSIRHGAVVVERFTLALFKLIS
jgi:hypothetical protein